MATKLAAATNKLETILVKMDEGALIVNLSRFYVFLDQNFNGPFGTIATYLKVALANQITGSDGKPKKSPLDRIVRDYNSATQKQWDFANPESKPWLEQPLFTDLDGEKLNLTLIGQFNKRLNILEFLKTKVSGTVLKFMQELFNNGNLKRYLSGETHPEPYPHLEVRKASEAEASAIN